jgi:sorbitol-specific phosphotransferase system component IIBC
MGKGDRIVIETPGAGGWGVPGSITEDQKKAIVRVIPSSPWVSRVPSLTGGQSFLQVSKAPAVARGSLHDRQALALAV